MIKLNQEEINATKAHIKKTHKVGCLFVLRLWSKTNSKRPKSEKYLSQFLGWPGPLRFCQLLGFPGHPGTCQFPGPNPGLLATGLLLVSWVSWTTGLLSVS